jgi:hypothetical protein
LKIIKEKIIVGSLINYFCNSISSLKYLSLKLNKARSATIYPEFSGQIPLMVVRMTNKDNTRGYQNRR